MYNKYVGWGRQGVDAEQLIGVDWLLVEVATT